MLEADEIILTNAVKGVQWVEFYEGKKYGNVLGKKIFDLIWNKFSFILKFHLTQR